MSEGFPKRLMTKEEIDRALELIRAGYRHQVEIKGSEDFVKAVREALRLVDLAGYGDEVRAYIRAVVEVEGFSQLRPEEATLWVSSGAIGNTVLLASLIVQKALQMKFYLEGKPFYGHICELKTTQAKYEFIRKLREKCEDEDIKKVCDEILSELEASIYDLVP
ncbi:MAG TPA: hypothetical protein ENF78_05990 [Candidatus Bathyarchaeota archaeon]|nr:hypothetical protein [Candidatus Bathyarchaeota archaeon]